MIGNRLQQLRNQKGLSQEALAALSGLSVRTIQRIEAGVSKPRAFTLKVLADSLQVNLDDLVKEEVGAKKPGQDFSDDTVDESQCVKSIIVTLGECFSTITYLA